MTCIRRQFPLNRRIGSDNMLRHPPCSACGHTVRRNWKSVERNQAHRLELDSVPRAQDSEFQAAQNQSAVTQNQNSIIAS